MPADLVRHDHIGASTSIMSTRAPQAHTNASTHLDRHPPTCPAEDDSVQKGQLRAMAAPEGPKTKVDKKSPEYLIKSMIAGGIAGCAVRTLIIWPHALSAMNMQVHD
jgi:hypothetical protein